MRKRSILKKTVYLFVGLFLLPACAGLTYSLVTQIYRAEDLSTNIAYFFIGFVSYLVFFLAFRKPLKTYVFGHELTHALWTILFRGKVRGINFSEDGGWVSTTKINSFIVLAPYFFPLYTVLIICIYFAASYFFDIDRFYAYVIFVIGFSWSFHLLLNIYILLKMQEDVKIMGTFFSIIMIYLLNFLILGFLIVFISKPITLKSFVTQAKVDIVNSYTNIVYWISLNLKNRGTIFQ